MIPPVIIGVLVAANIIALGIKINRDIKKFKQMSEKTKKKSDSGNKQQGILIKIKDDEITFAYGHNQQYQKSESENKEKKKKLIKPKKEEIDEKM
ncbi:11348_t:CDS:2 [Scutellospora calospora]|uniref:11348_t:CDS:1 n=1 Tax=Scutellospora calospora TaxID=85575 RepID=A0ACA9JXC4_9GLOM|nr:11348_t:CDS:2 [Scutellospora calospora]